MIARTYRIRSAVRWFSTLPIVLAFVLDQLWLFRALVGGVWIKSSGTWSEVHVRWVMDDGSRYFEMPNPNGSTTSFHETNISIEQIQDFT